MSRITIELKTDVTHDFIETLMHAVKVIAVDEPIEIKLAMGYGIKVEPLHPSRNKSK